MTEGPTSTDQQLKVLRAARALSHSDGFRLSVVDQCRALGWLYGSGPHYRLTEAGLAVLAKAAKR